jgi:hypothetical protein
LKYDSCHYSLWLFIIETANTSSIIP